jgi:FMN phosphatase YigB (HAD superfamily)
MIRAVIFDCFGVLTTGEPDEKLFAYIRDVLKPSYKLGVLSNAEGDVMKELFSPSQAGLFDAVVVSYEIGIAKPDPRAYQAIAKQLDVHPAECLFIDDIQRYCDAAEQQDMTAIWHHDTDKTIAAIDEVVHA